jgi:hypothetical protein
MSKMRTGVGQTDQRNDAGVLFQGYAGRGHWPRVAGGHPADGKPDCVPRAG